ncbi:SPOR domain-containing protein [Thiothrix litoralis]|jgi:cell division septation protein DedD|uniref:SPOR domain-containing protein n=1 Tax=Thiothrix litoralis TaxID=2891210 RepID=A0ABX7WUR9_9GAMM|nr:SPOR domain-containing protein [Thiothrix litoralis]QTR44670.1 SPOR domain-containing protein [Thiothrix litoralis]
MDNKATTKRMIGAVVLVLVAALLLAWLLKGKNRDGQQDMAMNQAGETKPILGFPGVGDDGQKPSIVGDDPNAAAQQAAGIDVAQQQQGATDAGQAATGNSLIPGVEVKLPETVANTTGFDVRPVGAGGEVRDLVDTDGKVKDGKGSMGTGDATASNTKSGTDSADQAQQVATQAPATESKSSAASSASQQDKVSTKDAAPVEKKTSSRVVLVNEKPVPRATSEDSAKAAAAKVAAAKKAAEDKAAAEAKAAAEKAAAAKSVALANAGAGGFVVQVMASSDKASADGVAAPLKADGYDVAVVPATVSGKAIYRVNVGGFADRAAADAAQAKMKARYTQNQAIQSSFVTSSK